MSSYGVGYVATLYLRRKLCVDSTQKYKSGYGKAGREFCVKKDMVACDTGQNTRIVFYVGPHTCNVLTCHYEVLSSGYTLPYFPATGASTEILLCHWLLSFNYFHLYDTSSVCYLLQQSNSHCSTALFMYKGHKQSFEFASTAALCINISLSHSKLTCFCCDNAV